MGNRMFESELTDAFPTVYEKYQDKKVMHIDGKGVRAAVVKDKIYEIRNRI